MDHTVGLESTLASAYVLMGIDNLIRQIAVPILDELHAGWQEGRLGVAHEHMTTSVLRAQLAQCMSSFRPSPLSPRILVTTPSGQHHELGAMLVAVAAARSRWHVTYLGPNTPAADIIAAANQLGINTVALSIVYPECNSELESQLRELRRGLGPHRTLLIGGRAAASCAAILKECNAVLIENIDSLTAVLERA